MSLFYNYILRIYFTNKDVKLSKYIQSILENNN